MCVACCVHYRSSLCEDELRVRMWRELTTRNLKASGSRISHAQLMALVLSCQHQCCSVTALALDTTSSGLVSDNSIGRLTLEMRLPRRLQCDDCRLIFRCPPDRARAFFSALPS